ncbi:MAG TPA: HD domain-containing phosphohydrolase [Ilumatobacteraceae bacterium]|nr:HD domain-containing phosphohydrolase [Ilumatobacteraceae bacterium]
MSATSLREGAGAGKSVRDLLDEARSSEGDDLVRSRALVQQARVLARSNADQHGEAEALYRLSSVTYQLGELDEAFGLALEARDLARRCGAPMVEVWALNLVGIVHHQAGNFSQALESLLQAVEIYRSMSDLDDLGNLLNTVAAVHHSLRDTDRAIVTYEAALEANRKSPRRGFDAITLANMAKVRSERKENLLAVSLGEAALEIAREHLPEHVAEILANLAEAYAELQMLPRANACLDEADESLNGMSTQFTRASPMALVAVQLARGRVCMATNDTTLAISTLENAVEIASQNDFADTELVAHGLLAEIFKGLGRFEEALFHREESTRIHEQIFDRDTDLRIKTLQISHDTLAARDQAELLRVRTTELEELVTARTQDLEEHHYEAFERLAVIAEYRDPDSGEHSSRVGELAAELAIRLGESRVWADELRLAGRLHDVGKVGVPDAILQKPGPLTDEEFNVMKTHTTIGATVFAGSKSTLIQLAAEVAQSHHERWDGKGYPAGLKGEGIPLSGRIVAVADVYDALITAHRYKLAWSSSDAVNHVVAGRGTQFEPRIVDALVEVIAAREVRAASSIPAAEG